MGEHTIREVLKRRSSATQRELQKRRDQIVRNKRSRAPLLVLAVVVVAIVGAGLYVASLASKISDRFNTDLISRSADPVHNLSLHSVTAFLPNTFLAVTDPGFFDASATTISPVTLRLVRLYFPDASSLSTNVMALVAQFKFTRTDILEGYLNDVHMGMDSNKPITGLVSASQIYFHKPFAELQPQDIALLVAVMGNPQQNDPRRFPDKALASRNAVLQADVDQTVLSQDQANVLSKAPLGVAP
ncbi:MAG TPA: transglycosylase domain-containing protein [Gammaproteobacteria bacterium]|nr:transglycosylase domain-containing protein [Gammaproteobacteria bacterium]